MHTTAPSTTYGSLVPYAIMANTASFPVKALLKSHPQEVFKNTSLSQKSVGICWPVL